jgi:hypothetical protein
MKRFAWALMIGMLFVLGGASSAWADYGHGHGHHHHHHGRGGYGYGYGNSYRSGGYYRGPAWQGVPHYDYHAPSLQYHRGHFDYIPGHYHFHRGGHWGW